MSVRPITDTLRAIRGGVFLDEAAEQLAELVKQVEETRKGGKLTLEITVKPLGKRSGALALCGKSTIKAPQDAPDETLMFATPEGNLLSEDPRQQKLDLKVAAVPSGDTQLKTAVGA